MSKNQIPSNAIQTQLPKSKIKSQSRERTIQIHLPTATIIKVIVAAALCVLLYRAWSFLMLIFMGMLLAVTFEPLVNKIARRFNRTVGVLTVALGIGAGLLGVGLLVVPEFIDQVTTVYNQLPAFAESVSKDYPGSKKIIHQYTQKLKAADSEQLTPIVGHIATLGGLAAGGLSALLVIYVFTIYLLFDGIRGFNWFLAFFGTTIREKIEHTAREVTPVISAYVIGQGITSALCAIFTFVTLSVMGVPGALMLAVLAAFFDVLPIVGFFLFAVPSVLFALTVSAWAAVIVALSFFAYHLLEAYYICPLVYGNRLRLSGIVVLFSLMLGALVGGVLGAIAILPIVASYPVIEEIWLKKFLGRRVIEKHRAISEEEEGEGQGSTPPASSPSGPLPLT